MDAVSRLEYRRYEAGCCRLISADVIAEATVTLAVNGKPWLAFLCTPRDLEALAVGFLYNEALISSRDDVSLVEACRRRGLVDVWLTRGIEKPTQWLRTSGCTGGFTASAGNAGQALAYTIEDGGLAMRPAEISDLLLRLFESQDLYRSTGGVHTSALADRDRIVLCAEDIGRHNTFDKSAGRCLLEGIRVSQPVLITTGRVSSEMLQKAARFGAPMVISRTSPTALSVELAERWGITLIGYARPNRFDVYTHSERIAGAESSLPASGRGTVTPVPRE
jgi:FdhD protein